MVPLSAASSWYNGKGGKRRMDAWVCASVSVCVCVGGDWSGKSRVGGACMCMHMYAR